ncbi:MAG: sugar phosphate isomerase/epimerase [Planctomycetes bacterium]|nr:sugar phosphate isomerase/epimerase [Planctomycetota bacterium]
MPERIRQLAILLVCLTMPCATDATTVAAPASGIVEVHVIGVDPARGRLTIDIAKVPAFPASCHVLLAEGVRPLARLEFRNRERDRAVFSHPQPLSSALELARLRAWLVQPDLVASLLAHWPAEAELHATIDCIGPGARSAWVNAGTDAGIHVGDTWWIRRGSQPVARLDVRLVAARLCFCGVIPLVSAPPLTRGERVALWPAPGQRQRGSASTAVVYVEERGEGQVVWVAAPQRVACPPERRLDFFRDGSYVGHGVVEQGDDRFWYARLLVGNPALHASGTGSTSVPADQSAAPFEAIRVGDEAVVRTQADLDQRRFVARVFEVTSHGSFINAGEVDGLARGDRGVAYRAGMHLGSVQLGRVQRAYAIVRLDQQANGLALRLGDEVCFGPLPPPAQRVGAVDHVVDDTLFLAGITAQAPLMKPITVRDSAGRAVCAVVLVAKEGSHALGFALDPAPPRFPAAGLEIFDGLDPERGSETMAIRLSYHAITWGPDTLGAIKDIADLGFQGIECFTQVADQYGDNPALFRRVLDDHGLRLVCLYGGGRMLRETRAHDIEYNRRVAEFVAAVGGDRLNLGGGDRRRDAAGRDHFSTDDVAELCETLNAIGAACQELGVKACYHPHIDTIGEERAHVERIFESTDPGVLFAGPDPGHLFLGGYDPLEFFEHHYTRIAYMHLKDVSDIYTAENWRAKLARQRALAAKDRGGGGPAGVAAEAVPLFCELGTGQLDLTSLVQLLRERDYDGWVTTEIDSTRQASPRESARMNRAFWESLGFSFD